MSERSHRRRETTPTIAAQANQIFFSKRSGVLRSKLRSDRIAEHSDVERIQESIAPARSVEMKTLFECRERDDFDITEASRRDGEMSGESEWRATAAYLYLLTLDHSGVAWEYLRRNQRYREQWHDARTIEDWGLLHRRGS